MEAATERLRTAPEIAKRLGVSEQTIYRLTDRGKLPVVRVGKALRFDPDEVIEALKGKV